MKRNSLMKSIAAGVLAFSLIIPAVPVGAQVKYDPTADGNDGIRINTSLVPNTEDVKLTNGNTITTRPNVKFQLDCTVDTKNWKVEYGDGASEAQKSAVDKGDISVSNTGEVRIDEDAVAGTYTIKASAQNVKDASLPATINVKVVTENGNAKPTGLIFNKELVEASCSKVGGAKVSDDGKKLTLDGRCYVDLYTIVTPSYILNDNVWFEAKKNDVYTISRVQGKDEYGIPVAVDRLTSVDKSSHVDLYGHVGLSEGTNTAFQDFTVVINEEEFSQDLVTEDLKPDGRKYTIAMNQDVLFTIDNNKESALPEKDVSKTTWVFKQGTDELKAEDDNDDYDLYIVKDKAGDNAAEIRVDKQDQSIRVLTKKEISNNTIDNVTISGTYKVDNTTVNYKDVNLVFENNDAVKVTSVELDFEQFDNCLKVENERINSKHNEDVYYFEDNGANLDLASLTYSAGIRGVRDFEESKDSFFDYAKTNIPYRLNYYLTDLEEFGSDAANAKYNNNDFVAEEIGSHGVLNKNNKLTLSGTGYKKLTIKGLGELDGFDKSYIIRLVSSSSEVKNSFAINNPIGGTYDLLDETIHIRQGESVAPEIKNRAGETVQASIYNPFVDFSFSAENIANVIIDDSGIYRINGLKSGKVIVTATGKVNKKVVKSFVLYVNNDKLTGEFSLNFNEAIASGKVLNTDHVQGKQDEVPVSVKPSSEGAGIPVLSWRLETKNSEPANSEFAEINPTTGVLTTKKSTGNNDPIVIVAEDSVGNKATLSFTIEEINAEEILTIEEKVKGGTPVVTSNGSNKGVCNAGATFTLYPSSFKPEQATNIDGKITWESSDETVATIDSEGVVNAKTRGQVVFTATYKYGGKEKKRTYSLEVIGTNVPVTGISVNNTIELSRIGATVSLDAKAEPSNATNGTLKYSSSDESVATVSSNGQVTGIGVGECTITITADADSSIKATVKVNVLGNSDSNTDPSLNIDDAKVSDAVSKINAIGTVTADDASKTKIESAKAAYDALTPAEKEKVPADVVAALNNAQSTYTTAKAAADKVAADKIAADKAAADKAVAAITALPADVTIESESSITAARAAYNALTPDQQKLVSADSVNKLTAAETAISELKTAKAIENEKAKIKVAKNLKGKKIKVGVANVNGAKGYQIKYSVKKNMKSAKTKNVSKTAVTLTKLKKKTYYIQVRAFSEYNGTKFYSKWSAKKRVKVNK